jgi:hypothetical protein
VSNFKQHVSEELKGWGASYVQDLRAIPVDALGAPMMGQARTPFDFTYEVAMVNRRMAARFRDEDPGPWPAEGWMTAPQEFRELEAAAQNLLSSVDEFLAAWDSLDDDAIWVDRKVGANEIAYGKMATMALIHISYHDAQLNYIQQLLGDMEMHWSG